MKVENLNEIIIDANWKAKPSERAKGRFKGAEVEKAICKGIERTLTDSDYGQLREAEGIEFWFKQKDEPDAWGGESMIGSVMEISAAEKPYVELRVIGRLPSQGGISLTLTSKHGQR